MESFQQGQLAIVGVAFGRSPVVAAAVQAFDAFLHDRQIGQGEFQVESLEVPPGVDRTLRVRQGRVFEGPHHVQQSVGFAQPGQLVGRQLLGAHPPLGRGRRRRQVEVGDVGMDDLAGLEYLGQPIEPLVGDLDGSHVQLHAAVTAGLGVAPGQGVEDGRLPRAGQPDDGDLHVVTTSRGLRSCVPRC